MANFFEVEFPRTISYRASGGPAFLTTINEGLSGFEQRNKNWATARGEWNISLITPAGFADMRQTFIDLLRAFFLVIGGQGDAFRLYDHTDNTGTGETLGTGDAATAAFQLKKAYTIGGRTYSRTISKPIWNSVKDWRGTALDASVKIYRNGALEPSARWTIDAYTGVINFAQSLSVVNITAATFSTPNTTYTYTLTMGEALAVGMRIVITGMANAGNNGTFYITSLGAGTFTVVNASGVTAGSQNGTGPTSWIPANGALLTADFKFHYPVRFDTDRLPMQAEESDTFGGKPIISVASLTLKEVRILAGQSQG